MQPTDADPIRSHYHVVPHFRTWAVRRLTGDPWREQFRTRDDAIARAMFLALRDGTKVVVHERTGSVRADPSTTDHATEQ